MIEGLWQCCCVQIVCNMSVAYYICLRIDKFIQEAQPTSKKKKKKLFE